METIDFNNPKSINGYDVIDNSIKETTTEYYNDIYSPGDTKQQLQIGQEVAPTKEKTGEIDTATATKTDNVYTLSVDNPDGKIFSLGIDGREKTFKIGYFGNTTLAYETLLTELQDWLGIDYTIAYVSGTNYSIQKYNGQAITITHPNLAKTITLNNFDSISVIDVIVDGTTITLDGATHGGNSSTAITYIKNQLSSSIYYMFDNSNILTIARKDLAIPVISKTQTPITYYTYKLEGYSNTINPTSTNLGGNQGSTECNFTTIKTTFDGTEYTFSPGLGLGWNASPTSISYNFSNITALGTQTITARNNYGTGLFNEILTGIYAGSLNYGSVYEFTTGGSSLWGYGIDLYKDDYSQITALSNTKIRYYHSTVTPFYSDVDYGSLTLNETITPHTADITIATLTEITITISLASNNYFIPCPMKIKRIEITAVSSGGTSAGYWTITDGNTCTTKYSSTTTFVNDKVFKTDANNYGTVIGKAIGGFIMEWTTNTSNKLNYKCT